MRLKIEEEVKRRMGPPKDAGRPAARAPARPMATGLLPLQPGEGRFDNANDVATVFAEMARQEITGRVDFNSEQRQKSVFFERGQPVHVYSSQVYDRMEEYLFRE